MTGTGAGPVYVLPDLPLWAVVDRISAALAAKVDGMTKEIAREGGAENDRQ